MFSCRYDLPKVKHDLERIDAPVTYLEDENHCPPFQSYVLCNWNKTGMDINRELKLAGDTSLVAENNGAYPNMPDKKIMGIVVQDRVDYMDWEGSIRIRLGLDPKVWEPAPMFNAIEEQIIEQHQWDRSWSALHKIKNDLNEDEEVATKYTKEYFQLEFKLENLYEQIEQESLKENDPTEKAVQKIKDVDFVDVVTASSRSLFVITRPFTSSSEETGESKRLGRCVIEMSMEDRVLYIYGWDTGANALTMDWHPHINADYGRVCLGEADPAMNKIDQGAYATALGIIEAMLTTYNPDDSYRPITEYATYEGQPGCIE